ncbi:MAG TPA: histidine--tRNA ligase [Prolixibacteraceae bacterium]|nr:histidine--tRNA ligase [Prolixibacteraceae bacterium]HPB05152.1 histidine--tRNA ligase [Prolixibacteraceae bacterium]HQN92720.1 histidine--tRNA ligase [Prolixibacteraceae bacterium]
MAQNPSIPKGTRDFFPSQMIRRNYIFDTVKSVFQLYGFQPIETPAMENLSTLMGKYGEEGDKLLFKVLNSGDFMSNVPDELLSSKDSTKTTSKISEKGLRYDLTVPFARFVVQNRNELAFPFKRYQIQPVWRADRPQKGRYREFFQCDVDVIGSNSLLNEVELIQIVNEVYRRLNISVTLKINNRKILSGIAETIGEADRIVDITVAIDKLDKIGLDKVNQELEQKGVSKNAIEKLQPILVLSGSTEEKLSQIASVISGSEIGMKGVEEMNTIFSYLKKFDLGIAVELDLTLARGLNYYTGAIFEVKANDVQIGSITGGGRYDDLTGIFGLPGVSGVGISFGADRIYDVMEQLNLFPTEALAGAKVLFINFGKDEEAYVLPAVSRMRSVGISCEIYPEAAKMKKQMEYANRKQIPYVILAGETEISDGKLTLKNMLTGEQSLLSVDEIISLLAN